MLRRARLRRDDDRLIAARSGASNGSIYHHFGSKDGILAALYTGALASYQNELLALLRSHADDAEAGIRGAVVHHLEWVEAHPEETRTLFEHRQTLERTARAGELRDQNRPVLAEVGKWVARHVEAGAIRDVGPGAVAAVWFGPAQSVARDWVGGGCGAGRRRWGRRWRRRRGGRSGHEWRCARVVAGRAGERHSGIAEGCELPWSPATCTRLRRSPPHRWST